MTSYVRFINPLLLGFEKLFLDWWLLRVFSLLYTPPHEKLKSPVASQMSHDIVRFAKGEKILSNGMTPESVSKKDLEIVLLYAEMQAVTSSPIVMALISLLVSVSAYFFVGLPVAGNSLYLYLVLMLIFFIGIHKYFSVRFNVYKMRRIVVDMK